MKLYLAGPMTGIPKFNFPAFTTWAAHLRGAGYEVVSPHEEDDQDVQHAAWASETGDMADLPPSKAGSDPLMTAIKNVQDVHRCDGVALLNGWQKSSGTLHELATAQRFGMPTAPAALWTMTPAWQAARGLRIETEINIIRGSE